MLLFFFKKKVVVLEGVSNHYRVQFCLEFETIIDRIKFEAPVEVIQLISIETGKEDALDRTSPFPILLLTITTILYSLSLI